MMEYKWGKTTHEIYRAIYDNHKDDFVVFETYTKMDSHGEKLEQQVTAWGFKEANHPIIRSEKRWDGSWEYSILKTVIEE